MAEGSDEWEFTNLQQKVAQDIRRAMDIPLDPDDFLMNRHKTAKCVKMHPETCKQIELGVSGQWTVPDGTIGTIAGIPIETDRLIQQNTAWVIPEAGDAPITVLTWNPAPALESEPAQAVTGARTVVNKQTFYVQLVEGEELELAHDLGIECIVQVFSIVTGRTIECDVMRRTGGIVLTWTLHDASPVEVPSINAVVVVMG